MHYIKLDQIICMVTKYGRRSQMAKFDVEAAYGNVAVHPEDCYLLGMKWHGQFYFDLALPFRLRSAPYILNAVADMVEWILISKYNVVDLRHYLDDFIMADPASLDQYANNLQTFTTVCRSLGLPLYPASVLAHPPVWWCWDLN